MADQIHRRVPVGAEVLSSGGVHFRVWAPTHRKVDVLVDERFYPLRPEQDGYFSGEVAAAGPGSLYKYRLDDGEAYPDPASRFQPRGPHEPSQVVDPDSYSWSDANWRGVSIRGQIIYEMHIGTFTPEGTWAAAIRELPALVAAGISVLEVMPVNEFPGQFGWGYDGVHPYAPTRLYGTPDDFRRFVDQAHQLGLGVILDVVYNHLGPDGNYFGHYSPYYFTDRHTTDWGAAINYYAEHCGPVREFFIANAGYWIDEFHLDGLRLDATQNVYDESHDHILAAITRQARTSAGPREVIVVAENEPQDVRLVRPATQGGYGMDALWNDDFHHSALVRMSGHSRAYYSDYLGKAQEFISCAKYGFLYQGQWYKWQKKRRGSPTFGVPPAAFITFTQNHDQVANSARGERAHQLTSPGIYRAMTALMLLSPGTPMLFQGQEFAASAPFLFFADHKLEIALQVREGRREFLSQFRNLAQSTVRMSLPLPDDRNTFERCKLDHSERTKHAEEAALHRDLIQLRKREKAFHQQQYGAVDGAVIARNAFVLRYFVEGGDDRLLVVNLGNDLHLNPAPQPLLAPPEGMQWNVLWSSEDPCYGGDGTAPLDTPDNWHIPGQAAVVLHPGPCEVSKKETKR